LMLSSRRLKQKQRTRKLLLRLVEMSRLTLRPVD
jgi:hypothetical protein